MKNGPEHFRTAQGLLVEAISSDNPALVERAAVHAALAETARQAAFAVDDEDSEEGRWIRDCWRAVAVGDALPPRPPSQDGERPV